MESGMKSAESPRPRGTRLKVVLYNPHAVFYTMPLALLAIGSELDPQVYEVVVIDARLDPDAERTVLAHIDDALCIGITVLTGAPISDALRISRAVKRARADLPVVWGGWHPSMFARECLLEPSVDVTVQGQGEETFAEILQRLREGRSLRDCAGCTVRLEDGSIQQNPARPLATVEKFRAHDYSLIPVERYFELKGKRQLDYISSQGCNFRCAFCSDPFVYGRKWVGLEPQRMALRLQELWDRYHFDDINFQDETFFTRRERVETLAERIIDLDLKITWAATMRADQGIRLPEHVWAKCKQSGLRRLLVGVESGSNEMLRRIRKDIKIEQVFATAERMVRHGIAGHFPFIVGFPDETDSQVQASLDVAKRLRAMSPRFPDTHLLFQALSRQRAGQRGRGARIRAARHASGLGTVRLRGRHAGTLGEPGEVRADRAVQVLPRAGVEAGLTRQAAAAAAGPPALRAGFLSLAGRDAVDPLARAGAEALMSPASGITSVSGSREIGGRRVLLINPTITSRRSARFPLAVLNLSAALDGHYTSHILDGNVDRDFVSTAVRTVQSGEVDAVGVSVMGGPSYVPRLQCRRPSGRARLQPPSSGADIFRPSAPSPASIRRTSTMPCEVREKRPSSRCWMRTLPAAAPGGWHQLPDCHGATVPKSCTTGIGAFQLPERHAVCPTSGWEIRGATSAERTLGVARPVTRRPWDAGFAARSAASRRCFAARRRCRPRSGSSGI